MLPELLASLRRHPNLILQAAPGAGKTTRVPPALRTLDEGDVIVLEPRRLAARLAARRVADESGEPLGESVGYQVRFEDVSGPRTRLRFMTEGVLTRRLLSDPILSRVSTVVLDEFHERHLEGDVALALLRRLQRTQRPALRLVVMSATMEPTRLAEHLDRCPVLSSEGRLFPLSILHQPHSMAPLDGRVASALEALLRDGLSGDVLVFLPGAAEIRRAQRACQPLADRHRLLLVPLHGDLPPDEQDRAVQPADRRKVILSTNVAESSITVEGVTAVIDSGLARIASLAPSGIPLLRVGRVSQASATQRAGRAGRTAPGQVIRLYPEEDFRRRPLFDSPEILRQDLSAVVLDLHAMGVHDVQSLPWLDAPLPASITSAEELLRRLGALNPEGSLTPQGRTLARMPLHPRLSRLVLEAHRRGMTEEGCALAALLSTGERLPAAPHATGPSDLLVLLEQPLSPLHLRLQSLLRRSLPGAAGSRPLSPQAQDEALLTALLAAYPDRVGRRRAAQPNEITLAAGGSALLASTSVVRDREFLVAVEIEERPDQGLPLIRLASAIEPDWLIGLLPDQVVEDDAVEWNRKERRVESVSALRFGALTLSESRSGAVDPERAAALLAGKAEEEELDRFADPDEVEAVLARIAFASGHAGLGPTPDDLVSRALRTLSVGLRSLRELESACKDGGLVRAILNSLDPPMVAQVERLAPQRLTLPSGRQARIRYARDQSPWVASRLQDFFGLRETPRIAAGRVPLLVHLLAPNQRPVQVTSDLAGFWERLYPQVRRELSRRYPRHAWPEDPLRL